MTDLHYLDPNPQSERPVIFLHGLGANAESWLYQTPVFAEAGLRPLPLDLPGFGRSPYDGRGWTLPRMAQVLAEFMDDLNLSQADVVGISMGGVVAQQFALDFPERVRKLVLTNTFAVLRPDNLNGWLYFLRRAIAVSFFGLEKQADLVARRIFPNPEQADQYEILKQTIASADPRAYRGAMRALGLYDARKRLSGLHKPVLVVTGSDDTTVSPDHQRFLAEIIPGARQVVIQGGGHGVIADAPDEFNRLVLDFLLDEPPAAAG